jgi:uncharacterized RDD family membrane protein YckC
MVDFIVLLVICGVVSNLVGTRSDLASVAIFFGVPFFYYLAMETAFGRTVGKFATGTIVIDEHGARPSAAQIAVRTLTRILEVNPLLFGGIPAGIIADRSTCRQRWGDMLARTYVVFRSDLPSLDAPGVRETLSAAALPLD